MILQELGVEVIKPILLEEPQQNWTSKRATSNLLKELIRKKVSSKLSDNNSKLVVDIDKYGIATTDGTYNSNIKVLVADLSGWE